MDPKTKQECEAVEAAIFEIGDVALKGKLSCCSACGHRTGYIFYADDVRQILYRLLRALHV